MAHIIIIGSGIAGLFAALKIADSGNQVTVITKQRLKDSSTNWAQGGIAGILDKTDLEGIDSHIQDTLSSGDGMCDEKVVNEVITSASECIHELLKIGVRFEKNDSGDFRLAKEGGHSSRRILHSKDATGKEIERALSDAAKNHQNIILNPNMLAIDLIQKVHGKPSEGISGVWCLNQETDRVETFSADSIILATGGVGQLWTQTTNPNVATGDGLAMAWRAGANVKDMAFIQFHPTALSISKDRPFLITEALRGEGGVILDKKGLQKWQEDCKKCFEQSIEAPLPNEYSFTLGFSPLGSMATRDIVARSIDINLKKTGENNVFLVTSHLDSKYLQEEFPNIQSRLNRHNLKLGIDHLPVAPAAHYIVGGLDVDSFGRPILRDENKIIPSLYAIGEVACTGMHGANRLASNSLLEAVVYADKAAKHIIDNSPVSHDLEVPEWREEGLNFLVEHAPIVNDLMLLRSTMSQEVGVVRRFQRLERASRRLELLGQEVDLIWRNSLASRDIVELRNLILVGQLVTLDALQRSENKGLHYNSDLS
ncbi:MAG: FAD-binding protein [Euryarchaeota archaeon]|mgnify:FL=1|jgi:L-aspartate oxidase|nr:FAD-binding protein [Euryarchaeota archaeon]MBT4924518.1 FAD-binding protein [Euryarchaeota archaeon]MBT7460223.1 FAD-binding protein [Euryarchaeota archaeon]